MGAVEGSLAAPAGARLDSAAELEGARGLRRSHPDAELSKRDRESVVAFLREQDAKLAPRVRREVRTKLETGRKV